MKTKIHYFQGNVKKANDIISGIKERGNKYKYFNDRSRFQNQSLVEYLGGQQLT